MKLSTTTLVSVLLSATAVSAAPSQITNEKVDTTLNKNELHNAKMDMKKGSSLLRGMLRKYQQERDVVEDKSEPLEVGKRDYVNDYLELFKNEFGLEARSKLFTEEKVDTTLMKNKVHDARIVMKEGLSVLRGLFGKYKQKKDFVEDKSELLKFSKRGDMLHLLKDMNNAVKIVQDNFSILGGLLGKYKQEGDFVEDNSELLEVAERNLVDDNSELLEVAKRDPLNDYVKLFTDEFGLEATSNLLELGNIDDYQYMIKGMENMIALEENEPRLFLLAKEDEKDFMTEMKDAVALIGEILDFIALIFGGSGWLLKLFGLIDKIIKLFS